MLQQFNKFLKNQSSLKSQYYWITLYSVIHASYRCFNTVVGVYINTSQRNFQVTNLQVNKEKLLVGSFSLFPCLCVLYPCCLKAFFRNQHWHRKSFLLNWYIIRRRLYIILITGFKPEFNSRCMYLDRSPRL